MGVRLPAEFQEVEYLESTGAQYIITDVLGQKDLIITSDQMYTDVGGDRYLFGWQGEQGSAGTAKQYICHGGNYQGRYQGSYCTYFWVSGISKDVRHKIVSDFTSGKAKVIIDGVQVWASSEVIPDFETERPFYLFCGMNRNGQPIFYYKGYLYSLTVSNANGEIANFIPCYRKSDDEPGVYDLVTNQFFTNAGTGEFLAGPDVIDSISPMIVAWRMGLVGAKATYEKYTPINKVSVIRKFYIDTEYIPSSKSSAEMKYMGTSNRHHFLACENFYFLAPRAIANRCGEERLSSSLVNQVVTISCFRGNDDIVVNGTTIATLAAGTHEPTTSLYLLTYHGENVNLFGFIGDFYYARIYDNDVLIRNYIPVKDSLGRVGILESISKRFWYGTDEDPAFSE